MDLLSQTIVNLSVYCHLALVLIENYNIQNLLNFINLYNIGNNNNRHSIDNVL